LARVISLEVLVPLLLSGTSFGLILQAGKR